MKKVILILSTVVCGFIIFSADIKQGHSNESGSPNANTGSPADGGTCSRSGCHDGGSATTGGSITSNIPVSGYIPGQTYTITASAIDPNSSAVKFGFQVSPQSANGTLLGTLVVTDANATKLTSAGKYITHKEAGTGNGTNGTRNWSFDWTAPATGTGSVTFYGAFNITNNNSARTGDKIFNATLVVPEGTVGINEDAALAGVTIYPNPSNGNFNLAVNNASTAVETNVFSAEGKLVYSETHQKIGAGKQNISLNLNDKLGAGVYFIAVKAGNASKVLKFIVQ